MLVCMRWYKNLSLSHPLTKYLFWCFWTFIFLFKVVTTAGWGLTGYNQRLSPELRSLNLTITTVRFIHNEMEKNGLMITL